MKTYDIILKNVKENSYRSIILFFAILHAILFVFFLFDKELWKAGLGGLIFIALYSLVMIWWTRVTGRNYNFGSGFFNVGCVFVFAGSYNWLFLADLILGLLSSLSILPTVIQFTPTRIRKRSFPYTKFEWGEMDNVILKDNVLTLDFKNNKLLQGEIQHYSHLGEKPINEEAFNTFAKEHLNK
jgi:hypothetical protein